MTPRSATSSPSASRRTLLVSVTGKELTEKTMADRPGYAEYVRRTSGFLPLPPGTTLARRT